MVSPSAISELIGLSKSRCSNCRKTRPLKSFVSSYFMHEVITVVFLLLSGANLSLGLGIQQEASEPIPSPVASKSRAVNVPTVNKVVVGETRHINLGPPSREVLKDAEISFGPPRSELIKDGQVQLEAAESKGLFFGEDANGVPIVYGTWFRYGSFTLAFAMFGTAFLVACAASAVYYVLFVVTEPSQQVRSADNHDGWNVGRVLRALQLAYETYETFDPYSQSCQLKTLCEIQESQEFRGSVLKRVTHYIIHTDLVQKKLENAEDLLIADRVGNDPKERCNDKFKECRFSLTKLYHNYITM